jgi:hypothetical protein
MHYNVITFNFVNIKSSIMTISNFRFVIVLLLALSCKQSDTSPIQTDSRSVTDTIRQTLNNYYADIKKEGLAAEFRYLDSSSDFFWVPPGCTSSISYDSVAVVLKQNMFLYKTIDNSWDTLVIKPLTGEFASYTGRIHSITTDTSGKKMEVTLLETGILVKRQNGWKLLSGQTSVINNP